MEMAAKKLNKENIQKFWKWFSKNCNNFENNFENVRLIDQLDQEVGKLGNFTWEIGPGKQKENMLVISPNGDRELLTHTKEVVKSSIPCPNWEFLYAKPPKDWNFIFDFNINDNIIAIDTIQWLYVLLKYQDDMLEIILKADNIEDFNYNDKLMAAEIALDSALGEENRLNNICGIEIVKSFPDRYKGKESSFKNIAEHIKRIFGRV
jgi:hypothetical protein